MIKWINFLHLYQPPSQTKDVVDQIVKESYSLIIDLLNRYPNLQLTMNINGSLLELWDKFGYEEIINSFKKLAEKGQIELVSSAMYHPILPLISKSEIERQIKLHDEISRKFFGEAYKPRGFYFPEMAYSDEALSVVKEMGLKWVILDEINADESIDPHIKYVTEAGLDVVFRNHEFSYSFPPEFILTNIHRLKDFVITAHDGELYGHWHKNDAGYYQKIFTSTDIETIKISDYLKELGEVKKIKLRSGSWETTEAELAAGVPFALWNDPKNDIHKKLWEFAESVELFLEKNLEDQNIETAKKYFSKGLASCAWWWASGRKLGVFSPVSWNPTEIQEGAEFLLDAARSLLDVKDEDKIKLEKMFSDLKEIVWAKHWSVYDPK